MTIVVIVLILVVINKNGSLGVGGYVEKKDIWS